MHRELVSVALLNLWYEPSSAPHGNVEGSYQCLRGALGALGEERVSSHFILLGEGSLRRALKNFYEHYKYAS